MDQEDDEDDEDDVVITTEHPENQEQQGYQGGEEQYNAQNNGEDESGQQNMQMDQQQDFGNFDQNMSGFGNDNLANMNMNGFNPMMGNFGMGMPNMMGKFTTSRFNHRHHHHNFPRRRLRGAAGMPGMGMDPSMMFNGNFGGMGDMSSMMGMGMGGAMGGMNGMGNFGGMNGPGFFPNQGNYMQSQNFGNAHRQNFFNDRGYGGRGYGGRGFGRGARGNQYGRGRGGWGYQQHQHQQTYGQNQQYSQGQVAGPQQSGVTTAEAGTGRRGSPTYNAVGPNGTPAESGKQSHDINGKAQDPTANTNTTEGDTNMADETSNQAESGGDASAQALHGRWLILVLDRRMFANAWQTQLMLLVRMERLMQVATHSSPKTAY